jgi:hypothetical protein
MCVCVCYVEDPSFLTYCFSAGALTAQYHQGMRVREAATRMKFERNARTLARGARSKFAQQSMLRLLQLFPDLASARMLMHAKCHNVEEITLANSIMNNFRRLDRTRPGGAALQQPQHWQ